MKKIITFLGKGDYQETTYSYIKENGEKVKKTTKFIQEIIYDIVGQDSIFYVALTKGAKETNWIDRSTNDGVIYKGLKSIFDSKGIDYKELSLYDGKNEQEMWLNFEAIFDVLEENDEVYVDVTHSFRSIPIIMMSVLNYAKFIKNISIKAIYYGAFDAKVDGIAPIFDLSLFSTITDWTVAAEKFINAGDSSQLSNIISQTIRPVLKETKGKDENASISNQINKNLEAFSNTLYTVRGKYISEYGTSLKNSLERIKSIDIIQLKPFEKILNKIYEKVYFYSNDVVRDIHNTVKLCKDLKLIQQAYTFMQENIINYICIVGGIDIFDSKGRELAETVLLSCHELKKDKIKLSEKHFPIRDRIKDYVNHDLADLYNQISDYRNDINHAGYRQDSKKAEAFSKKLDEFINEFERLVINREIS